MLRLPSPLHREAESTLNAVLLERPVWTAGTKWFHTIGFPWHIHRSPSDSPLSFFFLIDTI